MSGNASVQTESLLELFASPSSSTTYSPGSLPTDLSFHSNTLLSQPNKILLKRNKDEITTGDCVVCGAANSGFHFGCIACAACSAFFRRTIALHRTYQCRRDPSRRTKCPLDRRHRSNCKACRFARCMEMGMNPSGVQNLRDSIRAQTPEIKGEEEEMISSSIKNVKIEPEMCEFEQSSSDIWCSEKEQNTIEILSDVYRKSVDRRRMFYCNGSLREILIGTGLKMRPTHFDERYYKDKMRFELVIYLEMMNSLKLFRDLDADTVAESLVKNCAVSLAMLEKYYISVKNNGLETSRIIAPDGSYTDLSDHGAQFANDIFNQSAIMDKDTCLKLLYDPLREVLGDLGGALKHSQMTDTEFCALFAILLFNTAADLTPEAHSKVLEARNIIFKDWFNYYEKQAIDTNEASLLVGNTLMLLTPVRNALNVHRENFHVIRVFNVMEYDKLIDDLKFT